MWLGELKPEKVAGYGPLCGPSWADTMNRTVLTADPTVGAAQPAEPFGWAVKGYKDYSVAFARSLILKTPPPLRATRKWRKRNPWNKTVERKTAV